MYADWIGYFTLPANVEMVASMRRDFDRLASEEGVGSARRAELGEIFATSSRLERGFWEMAYTHGAVAGSAGRVRAASRLALTAPEARCYSRASRFDAWNIR